jgi:leader peptidase (prepilin peptidase)/N-methyltransferase
MGSAAGTEMLLDPAWRSGLAFVIGLMIGSFLNVVIHRLPRGESIVFPPSHCPGCDAKIHPLDNLPLLSYAILRGRCRKCRMPISLRYPAVELVTGCAFALVAARFGPTWMSLLLMVFAAGLIAAAMIDFDTQIIPDEISLGGLVLGLVLVPLARYAGGAPLLQAATESLVGALLGGGCLWSVGFLHARVSAAFGRTFAHWPGEGEELPRPSEPDYWLWFPGLGLGDVKLLAMIGAFVGPVGVMLTILAASAFGLAMGLIWAAVNQSWRAPFGFGPAIAAGALLALFVPRSLLLL